jgi:hypothetical protein
LTPGDPRCRSHSGQQCAAGLRRALRAGDRPIIIQLLVLSLTDPALRAAKLFGAAHSSRRVVSRPHSRTASAVAVGAAILKLRGGARRWQVQLPTTALRLAGTRFCPRSQVWDAGAMSRRIILVPNATRLHAYPLEYRPKIKSHVEAYDLTPCQCQHCSSIVNTELKRRYMCCRMQAWVLRSCIQTMAAPVNHRTCERVMVEGASVWVAQLHPIFAGFRGGLPLQWLGWARGRTPYS